jgi:hypothetical protein
MNEQAMFFEQTLTPVLACFIKCTNLPADLREKLKRFARDEQLHTAMFRQLNRRAGGNIYQNNDFCFVRVLPVALKILRSMTARPRWFPFVLWLMHLQEERSLYFGRQFITCEHPIEPNFVEAQRIHMADELSHVACDKELLDWIWPRTNWVIRYLNIRLLGWLMREFFGPPKRAQFHIIERLANELPEIAPRLPQLKRALLNLAHDERFLQSMYSRENVPEVFARFDRTPELWTLARRIPGYQPQVVT